MSILQEKVLLRRREVVEALGISDEEMTKLTRAGVIKTVYLRRQGSGVRKQEAEGRAFYSSRQIVKMLEKKGVDL
jgi:hypothetical protein